MSDDFAVFVYDPDDGPFKYPAQEFVRLRTGDVQIGFTGKYSLPAVEALTVWKDWAYAEAEARVLAFIAGTMSGTTPLDAPLPGSPLTCVWAGDSIIYGEVEGHWPRNAQLEAYAYAADLDRRFHVIDRPREIVEKRRDWEDRNYRRPKKRKRK